LCNSSRAQCRRSGEEYQIGEEVEAEYFMTNEMARPGDLICFNRGLYCHWGIYDGDGFVINVPAEGKNDTQSVVTRERLVDVANKDPAHTKVKVDNLRHEAEDYAAYNSDRR
jgi:cell wall-associated NlpC family hydrolase